MTDALQPPSLPPVWTQPAPPEPELPQDWTHLPPRGAKLAALGNALGFAVPAGIASLVLSFTSDFISTWLVVPVAVIVAMSFGAWLGVKRHRRTLWKLDGDGFAVQRGRWWQTETRVPATRVQHLDLRRGPLERHFDLSTLVIHTAGTRHAAVSVSGLDVDDAEHLRDRLARHAEHDDDAL